MNYHLAVCSHRRAIQFGLKTLHFLNLSKAPLPTVYVADEVDYAHYKTLYPHLEVVITQKGLANARNFVVDRRPVGERIVFLDDDVEDIVELVQGRKQKVRDFNRLVQEGFGYAQELGTHLWGIYPTDSGLCLKPVVRQNLCLIVGAFFGIINQRLHVTLEEAEDNERTFQHWLQDKKLCRLEFYGIKTKYYTNAGGMCDARTVENNRKGKEMVLLKYPGLGKLFKAKNGWWNIRYTRYPANFRARTS